MSSIVERDGKQYVKWTKREREDIARAESFNAMMRYRRLLSSLKGLTLDQVVEAWWEANE